MRNLSQSEILHEQCLMCREQRFEVSRCHLVSIVIGNFYSRFLYLIGVFLNVCLSYAAQVGIPNVSRELAFTFTAWRRRVENKINTF